MCHVRVDEDIEIELSPSINASAKFKFGYEIVKKKKYLLITRAKVQIALVSFIL